MAPRDPTSPDLEPYQIIGLHDGIGPNGRVPVRREITEWQDSTDPTDDIQVQLFLLALSAFQARSEHEKLSYFQIAGEMNFFKPFPPQSSTINADSHTRYSRDAKRPMEREHNTPVPGPELLYAQQYVFPAVAPPLHRPLRGMSRTNWVMFPPLATPIDDM